MDVAENNRRVRDFFSDCFAELERKNHDYCPTDVAYETPTRTAKTIGITTLATMWVNFDKQISAVQNAIRGSRIESETLRHRFMDIANYAALMAVLIEEEEEAGPRCVNCSHLESVHVGGPNSNGLPVQCGHSFMDMPTAVCSCPGYISPDEAEQDETLADA